ncbi:16S rRNA (uracil(1498)-N(3))-methyltransferase [Govanella unica]|uniref:Ribosomal RNA small subunit methyltransferase E n=1 Tax=Govanella unica TaxID=2975056 RepID=A0A9X3TXC8_9PROT|nr:16S rRNA (uracil(1498)-N(3))-methyltransferase [Govania unica]MDA5193344.1 16S rRNA (uracil(1498)-N(3))-methyltransferase [Govania unica]
MTDAVSVPYVTPIRLFVTADLRADAVLALTPDQGHYLEHVIRRKAGDLVRVFNGRDGEWVAAINDLRKGRGGLRVLSQSRPQGVSPDIWLLFAPIKRARLDFIVQKAVELGVSGIRPVFTRFTNVERVKENRLESNAIEAAEQCDRLEVPEIYDPQDLDRVLDGWDPARRLIFCDEGGDARPMLTALQAAEPGPYAVLIGPEGGFHADERARLRALPYVLPVSLGPRILRADTAAIVALTLWQSVLGDWRG